MTPSQAAQPTTNEAAERLRRLFEANGWPVDDLLDAALSEERRLTVERAKAQLTTDKHRLERSGRQMVGCSCGGYDGPTAGQSSADAWRGHLLAVLDEIGGSR